jgi:RNA polymerase-binding transcription factor DksA
MRNGGNNMDEVQEQLFLELRQTQEEIFSSLKNKHSNDWMTSILEAELADIKIAIKKIENGSYGHCETSGELLPDDLLKNMPTIKSARDSDDLDHYYRKPIDSSFF